METIKIDTGVKTELRAAAEKIEGLISFIDTMGVFDSELANGEPVKSTEFVRVLNMARGAVAAITALATPTYVIDEFDPDSGQHGARVAEAETLEEAEAIVDNLIADREAPAENGRGIIEEGRAIGRRIRISEYDTLSVSDGCAYLISKVG